MLVTTLCEFQVGRIIALVQIYPASESKLPFVTLRQEGAAEPMTQFNLQDIPFIEEAMSLATTWIRNYLWDYEVERRDLSPEQLREQIELGRNQIGFAEAYESARKWWEAFENENEKNPPYFLSQTARAGVSGLVW